MRHYAENVVTYVLQCAVFNYQLCGTMRKILDAFTATYGVLLPHMRYFAEIHNFSRTVQWAIYRSPCGKSPEHTRQHAIFLIIFHTALYYCCKTIIRYRAEK